MNMIYFIKEGIKQAIIQASIKREFINVDEYMRGIGKTSALIEFAKENDLTLIVPHEATAYRLRQEDGIKAYGQDWMPRGLDKERFVFDEGVDHTRLPAGQIATGFILDK